MPVPEGDITTTEILEPEVEVEEEVKEGRRLERMKIKVIHRGISHF
jgi:hypothetical protein